MSAQARRMENHEMEESWKKIITKYGLGGAIALILVWRMTMGIEENILAVRQQMIEHSEASRNNELTQRQILAVTQAGFERLTNIAIQNCSNQAGKDTVKIEKCFAAQYAAPHR